MVWGAEQVIANQVIRSTAGDEADARLARELAASQWYGVYRRPSLEGDQP